MFFVVLLLLSLLRVLIGFAPVPLRAQNVASGLITIVFIAAPIFALYHAARFHWTAKAAGLFVAVGLAIQIGIGVGIGQKVLGGHGFGGAVCTAIGLQCGFTMWCTGLGALLASILKDKNLLIPVSIFLAGFDIFLVITPLGATHLALQTKAFSEVFKSAAYSVPAPAANPTEGQATVLAYMGPADFLFMGMFFVSLFKFNLRTRQTLYWLIPAVLVAIALAFLFKSAAPMMAPIGLTVLLVNLPEFKMNKEEIMSTALVVILLTVIISGSYVLGKKAELSPSAPGPGFSGSAGSPAPANPG